MLMAWNDQALIVCSLAPRCRKMLMLMLMLMLMAIPVRGETGRRLSHSGPNGHGGFAEQLTVAECLATAQG
ncbi:hypothetical protein UYA_16950 [Ectopseudomonas alcaliphila JAB1]|nr:hypothetical protein UYA_16950 [Pseudomonas alcaliphila JAB1]